MMSGSSMTLSDWILAVLLFPRQFQSQWIDFTWGSGDILALEIFKRVFMWPPTLALLFCLWASIPNLCSVLFRSRRTEFIHGFVAAWWELGQACFGFIAGIPRALLVLLGQAFGVLRLALTGLCVLLMDILLIPFRAAKAVGRNVAAPGLPWIALTLTLCWCLLEAAIFTYVMTPLVVDTLSNLTGQDLLETSIRIPLFLFLLTLVLGSYAVLSAWTEAIRKHDVAAIVRITAVELVAVVLEVLFLYREFVDALLPWFAMHARRDFEPGPAAILAVAFVIWLGVRGMTWFLFASHGTPILLAVIQGRGLGARREGAPAQGEGYLGYAGDYYARVRQDSDWLTARGEELAAAFLLPPLQLVAACLNFLTLLLSGRPIFRLPFTTFAALQENAQALHPGRRPAHEAPHEAAPAPQAQAPLPTGMGAKP